MPLQEEQKVSNLIFFLRERPHFSGLKVSEVDQPEMLSEDYLSCAALEDFLWLHLGVQAEYFPKPEARRVTYEHFPRMLKAYEYIQTNQLIQKFTPPLQRIMQSEFGGRSELFSHNEGFAEYPEEMIVPFQTVLLLANGFASDPDAETFCDSLVFMNSVAWNKGMSDFSQLGLAADPKNEAFILARDTMSTVILKIVQYMECFRETLQDFDRFVKAATTKHYLFIPTFRQRVKEIQSWRLNFGEKHIYERFFEFVNVALMLCSRDAVDGQIEFQRRITPALVRAIRLLTTDWGGSPLTLEVGVH